MAWGNTITASQDISEHFNNFFTSIGQDRQKNIAPTKKHFSDYLKAPNTDTFYISSTTPQEISDLIKTLKNSKSLGPNRIPTDILKEIHETTFIPLSTLMNKSFTTGVFPNMCKIAKVVPIMVYLIYTAAHIAFLKKNSWPDLCIVLLFVICVCVLIFSWCLILFMLHWSILIP